MDPNSRSRRIVLGSPHHFHQVYGTNQVFKYDWLESGTPEVVDLVDEGNVYIYMNIMDVVTRLVWLETLAPLVGPMI